MGTQLLSRRGRALIIFATIAVGSAILVGCSATLAPNAASSAAPTVAAASDTAAEPTAAPDAPTEAPTLPVESAPFTEAVTFETGVSVEITGITRTDVEAETPGEVSGPAVVLQVRVTNASDEVVPLDSAVVMLSSADGGVGIGTTAGANIPFSGDLAPGTSFDSSYVFMLAASVSDTITVSVNYAAGQPVAEFTGKISS